MSITVNIFQAAPCHIGAMVTKLRSADAAEIEAAGLRPGRALWQSWRGSIFCKAAAVDGELAAVWGMGGSPLARIGQPWLLTTPAVERAKIAFVKEGRREVAEMLVLCPGLTGYVDATYLRAIRLLEVFGFTVENPLPFGAKGALFRRYVQYRRH